MITIIKRYQIIIFILVTFAFSWFPWYAGIAPEVMTIASDLSLTVLAVQVVAALILIFVTKGRLGHLNTYRSAVHRLSDAYRPAATSKN